MLRSARILVGLPLVVLACTPPVDPQAASVSEPLTARRLLPPVEAALAALPRARVTSASSGVVGFVRGDLGRMSIDNGARAPRISEALPALFGVSATDLLPGRAERDELGLTHLHYQQLRNGEEVENGQVVVHLDRAGLVFAVHGGARGDAAVPSEPAVGAEAASRAVHDEGLETDEGRLTYLVTSGERTLVRAWAFEVRGFDPQGTPIAGTWYVNAADGRVVDRSPRTTTVLARQVFDAGHREELPGTPVRAEGDAPVGDLAINAAYVNTGTTHACLAALFSRDAHDGQGGAVISTVHFSNRYNNAFWNGAQMVFGDGDGQVFSPLSQSFDVTAHELVHGVTQYTAGLVYQNEPGALNEAMSDVLSASCEAWRDGRTSTTTWQIGEEVFTPRTAGDAIRYLDHPTRDGVSSDFYPERYQGSGDNGGVHLNSGIVNLAFTLLARGGAHPRGRSSITVPALGIGPAAQIYYRALAHYLTPISKLEDARAATVQAAADLFGPAEADAVQQSWNAVGVLAGQGAARHDPVALQEGVTLTGISGDAGEERIYFLDVPAEAVMLSIEMASGSGEADLYVRHGEAPTLVDFDHRPYLVGNSERVDLSRPITEGRWFVMVQGYGAFRDVTLTARFVLPQAEACTGGLDEDFDGQVDCFDPDCARHPACLVELCDGDGVDDDTNGLTDCADPHCWTHDACAQVIAVGELVITELLVAPLAAPDAEWIEILNTSSRSLDLAGLSLTSGTGWPPSQEQIVRSVPIAPHGYVVLARQEAAVLGFAPDHRLSSGGARLADAGGRLDLLDRDGRLLDRVDLSASGFLRVRPGISLEATALDPAGNDAAGAWCYSAAAPLNPAGDRGTPRASSECSAARARPPRSGELVISEIAAPASGPAWIEVLSLAAEAVDLYGLSIDSTSRTTTLDRSRVIASGERVVLCAPGAAVTGCDAVDLALAPQGATITLRAVDGVEIDRVAFSTGAGWPAADASGGARLELSELALDTTDNDRGARWCASAGTPARRGACGPSFTAETLGTFGGAVTGLSLSVEASGVAHLSWGTPNPVSQTAAISSYHGRGAQYAFQPISGSARTPYSSLAIDATGGRHYLYFDVWDQFTYAGPRAQTPFQGFRSATGQGSVVVDSEGRVHLIYGTGTSFLWEQVQSSSGWQRVEITSSGRGGFLHASRADASGTVYVAYFDPAAGSLYLGRSTRGGAWSREYVDSIQQAVPPALAIAADGTVHVAYYVRASGAFELRHAELSSTGVRRFSTVDRVSYAETRPGLAVDARGRAHVVYQRSRWQRLRYAGHFGAIWSSAEIDTLAPTSSDIELAITETEEVIAVSSRWDAQASLRLLRRPLTTPALYLMSDPGQSCGAVCAAAGRSCGGHGSVGLDCGAQLETPGCDEAGVWIHNGQWDFCTDNWGATEACGTNWNIYNSFCCRCE